MPDGIQASARVLGHMPSNPPHSTQQDKSARHQAIQAGPIAAGILQPSPMWDAEPGQPSHAPEPEVEPRRQEPPRPATDLLLEALLDSSPHGLRAVEGLLREHDYSTAVWRRETPWHAWVAAASPTRAAGRSYSHRHARASGELLLHVLPRAMLQATPLHSDSAPPLLRALRLSRFELAEWLLEWGGPRLLHVPGDNPLLALALGVHEPEGPQALDWVKRFRQAGYAWDQPGKWGLSLQQALGRPRYVSDGLRKAIAATGGPKLPPFRDAGARVLVDARTGALRPRHRCVRGAGKFCRGYRRTIRSPPPTCHAASAHAVESLLPRIGASPACSTAARAAASLPRALRSKPVGPHPPRP